MNDLDTTSVSLETARACGFLYVFVAVIRRSGNAYTPLKASVQGVVRSGVLLHRVSALATASVQLFEQHNYLGGIIVTRSILETVAVAFALERSLRRFSRTKDAARFDRYLMQLLVSSGAPDAKHPAMNISSLIEAVDKRIPGFRNTYHSFSEYAHPNWSGLLGAFGAIDESSLILRLGMSEKSAAWAVGVHALADLLAEFQHLYNELLTLITELNEHFEKYDAHLIDPPDNQID